MAVAGRARGRDHLAATARRSSTRSGRHSATWRALSAEASALASPDARAVATASRAQRLRARAVGRVVELDREARLQPRAQRAVLDPLERLLEPRDRLGVEVDDRDAQPGEAERRLGQQLRRRRGGARARAAAVNAVAGRSRLARAQQRVAAGEQDRAGSSSASASSSASSARAKRSAASS